MKKLEEKIKLVNNQLIEQGNIDIINEIFSTDYIAHAGDSEYKGYEFIKRFAGQIRSAIPDIKVVKTEFFVQAGNSITWQRTYHGTHKSGMMGIPPSNKKLKWTEMGVTRFKDEKIAEEWVVSELAGQLLLKQPRIK